ncbi:MAG: arginine--tRNA ligase [Phycisphaerales bacterium]
MPPLAPPYSLLPIFSTLRAMSADPQTQLRARFDAAIAAAFAGQLEGDVDPLIAPSKNPQHGDFQANVAMSLAKRLGQKPRDVAQAIVGALELDDLCEPPEVAGPGFINLRLKTGALADALEAMRDGDLGVPTPRNVQTVVVDLCGVNLAKQMHVGHLRATVIGDAIARLWERLGHTVVRQNHFGDWGLPIAMVTGALKAKREAGEVDLDALSLEGLEREYRAAQEAAGVGQREMALIRAHDLGPKVEAEWEDAYASGQAAREHARASLVALQEGDVSMREVWERISRVTLDACFENCARLGANVTDEATAGESTYRDELAPMVADLVEREVAVEDDGALVVRLEEFGIQAPCLVRKRDGGFLYATTDICAIRRRVQTFGAHRVIYAVDARQSLHFRQVFAASHKAGYATRADGTEAQLIHASFGTVLGEDGTPFKTRSGDNVKLSDLLDEAIERAARAVAEKNPDLSEDERADVARAVGIGAIKHADLSTERVRDYVFGFDRMLAFEGNTGPYVQYAVVRTGSMLRKAAERLGGTPDAGARLLPDAPEERTLALALLRYASVLEQAAEHAEPHRLCAALYDIASAFSGFFASCPALGADDDATRDSRLALTALTGRVLRDGLGVLGIETPDRM